MRRISPECRLAARKGRNRTGSYGRLQCRLRERRRGTSFGDRIHPPGRVLLCRTARGGCGANCIRNVTLGDPSMITEAPAGAARVAASLPKASTGISGLDEITDGGLPRGRPTLVCGSAGCGKTLLAMEFLIRGATQFGEPGAYITFEETEEELAQNVRSLGHDVERLVAEGKLAFDHVHVERQQIEEAGDYDLEGLFLRIGLAIDSVGARRVVLDTIESLFSGFSNPALLRAELRRLFRWLKDRGVTAVITAERGE